MKKNLLVIIGVLLFIFGLLTIFMGSSVLLDWFGIRAKEGNFVPFVVRANVFCGFLYLLGGYGYIKRKHWTTRLLLAASVVLIVTFISLFIYIEKGGIYETKTIYAMTFRTSITIITMLISYFFISKDIKRVLK